MVYQALSIQLAKAKKNDSVSNDIDRLTLSTLQGKAVTETSFLRQI